MSLPKGTVFQRLPQIFLLLAAAYGLPSPAAPATEGNAAKNASLPRKTQVLLVTGQDYPGHPWQQTAPALKELLEKDPRLSVCVLEDPHFLDSQALTRYDLVLLHFMNWEQPSPGPAARENLRRFVEGGKGLMLVHFACGAWQDWPGFKDLAGRAWDPKLRGHDPHGRFRVEIADPQHPITRGLDPFETVDELYTCLAGERPIHVIATARSKVDGKDYPMAFVLDCGKGRVFHTVLGHDLTAVTNSSVPELLRRGCAWAAGLPPLK
jgi:type 1 glutamine amidotransferase